VPEVPAPAAKKPVLAAKSIKAPAAKTTAKGAAVKPVANPAPAKPVTPLSRAANI